MDPNAVVALQYECASHHAGDLRTALQAMAYAGVRFQETLSPRTLMSWLTGRWVTFDIRCPEFFRKSLLERIAAIEGEQAVDRAF